MDRSQKLLLIGIAGFLTLALVITWFFFYQDPKLPESTMDAFLDSESGPVYTDVQGVPTSLESYLGTIVVATAWASWSPFSEGDFAILNELSSQYKDTDVRFLAINRDEPKEQAQRYLSTIAVSEDIVVVIDTNDSFYKAFSGYAMPETVILGSDGQIVHHFRDRLRLDEVKATIDGILTNQ